MTSEMDIRGYKPADETFYDYKDEEETPRGTHHNKEDDEDINRDLKFRIRDLKFRIRDLIFRIRDLKFRIRDLVRLIFKNAENLGLSPESQIVLSKSLI